VGSFVANGYGLYDMAGNVWEWCSEASDSSSRYVRGGGWSEGADYARCGCLTWRGPSGPGNSYTGFRAVCR
jgi:formylglycine-generating enzyme required for sulfatase activity